jgi:hypothetical protein
MDNKLLPLAITLKPNNQPAVAVALDENTILGQQPANPPLYITNTTTTNSSASMTPNEEPSPPPVIVAEVLIVTEPCQSKLGYLYRGKTVMYNSPERTRVKGTILMKMLKGAGLLQDHAFLEEIRPYFDWRNPGGKYTIVDYMEILEPQ